MENEIPAPLPKRTRPYTPRPCRICYLPHDEEIHAATLSIHLWLRSRIKRSLELLEEELIPAA